jgi:tetratricopeptide (TPR) repeat protein
MSIRLLYICFCILPLYLSAQTQVLDSLLEQLPTLPVDTTKVNELVRISGQYRMVNLEKAIQYGHQANRLAQRLGHDRGQAKAVYQLAIAQLDVAAYDSALYYSQQTVQWSSQLEWPFLEGLAYNLTGSIFRSRRQSDKALEAFFQSLEIGQGMGDSLGMAYALNNIANVYIDQQDSLTAAKYHREALTLARDQQDPFLESTILTNLASVSAPADRKRYLQQGLLVAEEIEALSTLVFTHNNLGGWYLNFTQQIDSARYHFQRSLDLSRKVGDTYSELAALHSLANLEIRTGNLSAVNTLLATAGKLLPEAGQAEERLTHFRLSSELAARRGDYQQAFQQLERSLQWRDSLHNQQMAEAVTDATIRFETEKKETQILNQKLELARQKRRQGILILSSLLILTLLSTFFLLRYQRLRLRKKQSEEKLQFEARKAQEMADLRSRFFADIAHELRTPLTLNPGAPSIRQGVLPVI